jgi:stage V sporulation protein AE
MDYLYAFLIGGGICVIGQILMDATKLTTPRVLVIFVVAGAVLTGLGLYEPLVKLAKNGATVPLPGFGYALAKGAMDGASKGFLAVLSGGIKNTAAGVTAAVVFGYIISLIFSPKSKR